MPSLLLPLGLGCAVLALIAPVLLSVLQRGRAGREPADRDPAMVLASSLPRADLLAAVRHELRLPLGAHRVPRGALYLAKATSSSVVVAASDRRRTVFVAELTSSDTAAGSVAEYRVPQPDRGRAYQGAVLDVIVEAVRAVDPSVRVDQPNRRAA